MSKILYSISDAFKELNSLKESEQFELRNDKEVEKLADFLEDEEISEPIEQIVDINAENENELQDSYVGDIIIECPTCKTKMYTKEEVLKLMKENNTAKIEELFSKDDKLENRNLMALYKEILGNRKGFFEEVFRNNVLGELRLKKIPILAAVQLNREEYEEGPNTRNIAESDRIGQDCTTALFIERKGDNVVLTIGKARNAKTGDKLTYAWNINMGTLHYIPSEEDARQGNGSEDLLSEYNDTARSDMVF